ncbi:hypothetical protein BS78_05G116200 [Paspalum vaginatum]|nr:hypothetical protein BS78_05G116200 [Paspalum vaginatum]KAJ1275177.1 hypothetical protein BS78_05G116200 [Paspalum vaginatum]
MDFSGTQGELAIPMHANAASPYGGLQLVHHEHGGGNNGQPPAAPAPRSPASAGTAEDTEMEVETPAPGKKPAAGIAVAAKYRECLKNHAAAIGGNATDGCGEFMPSGEEGSLEALKCSACGCHRNFHRKEAEDEDEDVYAAAGDGFLGHRAARRLLAPAMTHAHVHPHHKRAGGLLVSAASSDPYGVGVGVGAYAAARALPPALPAPPGHGHQHQVLHHQYVMPLSMMPTSESDELEGAARGGSSSSSRKRFRTKFTPEQKARMLEFAERVGWRLQKLDDAMVQAFCQEIGVKRRVLKVWMHNNKHNLATKRLEAAEASPPPPPPPPPQQQQAAMAAAAAVAMASPPPMQMPAGVMPPPPQQQQQQAGPSCLRGGHVSPPPPLKLE